MTEAAGKVSVVIPARNEEPFIRSCLDSVTSQTYRDIEVIVVDGASTDRTVEIVREVARTDPRVSVVDNPDRVIPVAMNVGLAACRGEWLVRIDAHSTVPPEYVALAVDRLQTGEWGGVGGRKDAIGVTPAGLAIAAALGSPYGAGSSLYHHGTVAQPTEHIAFGAYPVALARSLGGWNPTVLATEDVEFDYRVRESGRQLLFDPVMRIAWVCRQSVWELMRQYARYGRGKMQMARVNPRSLSLRHVVPLGLVAVIVAAALLAPFRPWWALIAIAPYAALVGVGVLTTARRVPTRSRPYLLLVFPAMHVGWGLGMYRGLVDFVARR